MKQKRKIYYLETSELTGLFKAIKSTGNTRDLVMFKLVYHLGLRISEAVNIELTDLHEKLERVTIRGVKNGLTSAHAIINGDQILLRRWLKVRTTMANAASNPYLFITNKCGSGKMQRNTIQKAFARYAAMANIPRVKHFPHTLRHSTAISLLQNGATILDVKERLRHQCLSSTACYLGLSDNLRLEREKLFNEKFTI